uniref:Uncharacterized protein n=1 Tax=viral metagenome TaxID=1070528 RepID=A0A6C0L3J2_9ZZZZ|tara:strand:+ start:11021 stop:12016 length:996 start_codon:yes stop_codon:yes gene_type:complete
MNINKTGNLYENWVKKPEMLFIWNQLEKTEVFRTNKNLIILAMFNIICDGMKKNFSVLTSDSNRLRYYQRVFGKICNNLSDIYDYKYHKICHYGISYYYYLYRMKGALRTLIHYEIEEEYLPIETFFRGVHQIIEINLLYLMKEQDKIEMLMNIDNDHVQKLIYRNIQIWTELIDLLNLLASLDELTYQKYRNMIYGTSGGESINLRKIQKRIHDLDKFLSFDIQETLMKDGKNKNLISSIKLYQYYSSQFWLTHFNLAASTNGIQNKGTKETPILKLMDKCIHMTKTRINTILYEISMLVNDDTVKRRVIMNDKERIIGISIYNSSRSLF